MLLYTEIQDRYDCFGILYDDESGDCANCSVSDQCRKVFEGYLKGKRYTKIPKKSLAKSKLEMPYQFICGIPFSQIKKLAELRNLTVVFGKDWTTIFYSDYAIIATNNTSWYAWFPKANYENGRRRTLKISDIKELDDHVRYYIRQIEKHKATFQENTNSPSRKKTMRRRNLFKD